jgi:riboflavin biosynthesis pyrimidine reductase
VPGFQDLRLHEIMAASMREFEILFDESEGAGAGGAAPEGAERILASYGPLTFPSPPGDRPWIYANFVQSLDGIVSLLGEEAGGADLAGIPEDRWLMDLLRVHADAVMVGMGTLRAEQRMRRPGPRGPVFRIVDSELRQLRERLGRGRERNVLVSAAGNFSLDDFAVFDGAHVDATIVTTPQGAERLRVQMPANPRVDLIVVEADGQGVELTQAVYALRRRYGIRSLLYEGGPRLFSAMLAAGLMDELFLTVSPMIAGAQSAEGQRPSLVPETGLASRDAVRWRWLSCRRVGDYQFHRFRRA